MYPDTRARTETVFTASSRPGNSSHSVIWRSTTSATVTRGSPGSAGCAAVRAQAEIPPAATRSMTNGRERDATTGLGCIPREHGSRRVLRTIVLLAETGLGRMQQARPQPCAERRLLL